MDPKKNANLFYLAVVRDGELIFSLTSKENSYINDKTLLNRHIPIITAFLESFSDNSYFIMDYEDYKISYEKGKNLAVIYAVRDLSEETRTNLQFFIEILERIYRNQIDSKAFNSRELIQLNNYASGLFQVV